MPLSDKQACLVQCRYISQSGAFHVAIGKYPVADKWSWVWKHTGKDDILSWYDAYRNQCLGRCSNNQNGNLIWILPLGVQHPPSPLDRVRKSARRASGCIATSATTATGISELFSLWENNLQPGRLSGPPGNQKTYNTIHKTFQYTLTFSRPPGNFADHLENIKTI